LGWFVLPCSSSDKCFYNQNPFPPKFNPPQKPWFSRGLENIFETIYLYGLNEEWNDFFVASVVFQNNFLRPPKYPMCIAEFTMFMNCSPARDDVHIKIIANLRYAGKK
jgi:hypothetical protein